jgi:CDP-paratose 2-epimerase
MDKHNRVCVITGSGGLIGSESVRFMSAKFDTVIGIDNDMRSYFFGDSASVNWNINRLTNEFSNFVQYPYDIRHIDELKPLFEEYGHDIELIIHAAAQPSHDWAAKEPITDFTVNANGTLNLLELTRHYCPNSTFIFTSTNKVYGDSPNYLPLVELDTRWEIDCNHDYYHHGIDEHMSIDQSKHSVFGASKVAADIMVQEYGRYFGMNTGVFRGGCLTGPNHSGAQLHGFLAYLMKCTISETPYTIFGYKGKQVRDNIHSFDLVNMFWHFHLNPRQGEVYNAGGGRFSNCSMLEAIDMCEQISGKKLKYTLSDHARNGDHIWYISSMSKFIEHYPKWTITIDLNQTLTQIHDAMVERSVRL